MRNFFLQLNSENVTIRRPGNLLAGAQVLPDVQNLIQVKKTKPGPRPDDLPGRRLFRFRRSCTMTAFIFMLLVSSCTTLFAATPHAFPVPFTPSTNSSHTKITFTNLPASGTIKIYTTDGRLVVELPIPNTSLLDWAVTNSKGEKLATGVYIYLIKGDSTRYEGKLVIIR
ncbi:MAG: hypothetical protein KCHDKBKB_00873 [Elusimicrobia bacterium]|nr:hypothetical protein [Elusimicrobiota bacterium]